MSLTLYVIEHSKRVSPEEWQHLTSSNSSSLPEKGADVIFFVVTLRDNPTREELLAEIKSYRGVKIDLDIFDGAEHSFMDLGIWLEQQGLALQLMGMGALLDLWELRTPYTIYGKSLSRKEALRIAQGGQITIRA